MSGPEMAIEFIAGLDDTFPKKSGRGMSMAGDVEKARAFAACAVEIDPVPQGTAR
jgi:hypothetical protein